jgi:hypothetical protein
MIEAGSTRTTKSSLHFKSAFRIGADAEVFPAGHYDVLTTEAIHEGNERTVYRRVSTVLTIVAGARTRYCDVEPSDLEAAIQADQDLAARWPLFVSRRTPDIKG